MFFFLPDDTLASGKHPNDGVRQELVFWNVETGKETRTIVMALHLSVVAMSSGVIVASCVFRPRDVTDASAHARSM